MTIILLQEHDTTQHVKRINCTEMLVPEVIEWRANYYRLSGRKAKLIKDKATGVQCWHKLPFYRQCRGANLRKIQLTPSQD